jgi:M6 family metalloprotease-like protein
MKRITSRLYALLVMTLVFIFVGFSPMPGVSQDEDTSLCSQPRFRPANPCPFVYRQPDGTTLTIYLGGDERVRFARTTDDYTILPDEKGMYFYALADANGNLVRSNVKANEPDKRRLKERKFLKSIQKNLFFSPGQLEILKRERKVEGASIAATGGIFPPTGNRKVLVILVGFQDVPFSLPQADFDGLMNTPGFNGYGSFKEYHEDNSFNQLILTSTVVGPYTCANNMAYYGRNRGGWDARPRNMVQEGVDAAEAAGLDFSQFDNDSNGYVDGIIVIHAGYDEAAGADPDSIWSHAWTLAQKSRTYDGVIIDDYCTTPELSGTSGTNISDIGVLVHEFGHNLGLPDTYDTDYEQGGGYAYGTAYFDVMADGCWNNGGFVPANHIAYAKTILGWQTATVLNGMTTSITLPNSNDNNVSYRINTTTSDEYFLLENRQLTGWDTYIEGHGMLIYHIDGPFIDADPYSINANPSHQGVDIEEADNHEYWGESAAGDPFPGTTNNTSFTDTTTPNSKAWNGADSGVPITNIAENGGVISFDVGSGGGGDQEMYVGNINVTVAKQGKNYKATATITILGSPSGNPVEGASVDVTWSGVVNGSDSKTTISNGTVSFTSARVQSTGPFTITVDNVTHATLQYAPALNVETSDSGSY